MPSHRAQVPAVGHSVIILQTPVIGSFKPNIFRYPVSAFALPHRNWIWMIFIAGLKIVVLPVTVITIEPLLLKIHKSYIKIVPFRSSLLIFPAILVLPWFSSWIKIGL
jgi:hypothetical protein